LENHIAAFVENDITMELVPFLTEAHLEALGITKIGMKLKVMAEIEKMRGEISPNPNPLTPHRAQKG
jgi:hypothetical protein